MVWKSIIRLVHKKKEKNRPQLLSKLREGRNKKKTFLGANKRMSEKAEGLMPVMPVITRPERTVRLCCNSYNR